MTILQSGYYMGDSVSNHLCSVSEIILGVFNKHYTYSDLETEIVLVRPSDIDKYGSIAHKKIEHLILTTDRDMSRYYLKTDDVVLIRAAARSYFPQKNTELGLSRGPVMRAGVVSEDIEKNRVLASTNCIVIRPNENKLCARFLVTYLNSSIGQYELLKLCNKGAAALQHFSMKELKNLEVPIPQISDQEKIANMYYESNEAYKNALDKAEQYKRKAADDIVYLIEQMIT